MSRFYHSKFITVTGFTIVLISVLLVFVASGLEGSFRVPSSILNMNTIFLSILIEALPFVLIGVIIAGLIQIFVTEEHIRKWIPKNKYLAVFMSCVIGALFPACECGIVPIVRRLVSKGVPIYAAIGFMLTGPLINPIVIASTYMAFGNDLKVAALRMGIGFLIALIVALAVSFLFKGNQFNASQMATAGQSPSSAGNERLSKKLWATLVHSIDEFFDMGKFLVIGALLAAFVQTYMPAKALLEAADGTVSSIVIMMVLAFVLSLCSEADAFIGASFSSIFPISAVLGFLIYGPMMDLKNTLMMLSVFRFKFVMGLLALITSIIFITMLLLSNLI